MTNAANIKVGDTVRFGRGQGEKTLAEVVRVNAKTLGLKTLEIRGTQKVHPVGSKWKVPYSMVTRMNTTERKPGGHGFAQEDINKARQEYVASNADRLLDQLAQIIRLSQIPQDNQFQAESYIKQLRGMVK